MKYLILIIVLLPFVGNSQEELPKLPAETKVYKAEIVDFPDVEAEFSGGREAMDAFIKENLQYPEVAKNAGIQGKVFLSFVVGKEGMISQVKVERGVSKELDREAKRIIRSMPNWKPAEAGGKPVVSRYRLPIFFKLSEQ